MEVDLASIPPNLFDASKQPETGSNFVRRPESIVPEAVADQLRQAALGLSPDEDIQVAAPGQAAPTAGTSFDAIDYTECCGGGGSVPPDPEMATGRSHLIAVVNVAFKIFNKSGTLLAGPTTFSSFFAANTSCVGVFDPNVIYDEEADRFILGIDANGDHYCVAVSQTSDPTGSWYIYAVPTQLDNAGGTNPDVFFDYPHAGVGRDAIYLGGNNFNDSGPLHARVWALSKTAMYAGSALTPVTKALPGSEDTPQPMNLHGYLQGTWPGSGPHYFITDHNFNGADYGVWAWSNPFGANTLSNVGTVSLPATTGVSGGFPIDAPQSGSSSKLQANDWRPQDAEYRNGRLWMSSTVSCNPGSGTVDCVQWAQIDPTVPSVVQAGVFASNSNFRTFADLAADHCDSMVVGYTKTSTSIFPSVFVNGRLSTDMPGSLGSEVQLKAGEITYTAFDVTPHRWGDYSGMTIDPDGQTFWYLGEYSKDTGTFDGRWGTYISSFTMGTCIAPSGEIFSDGFESGDTSAWSLSVT